MVQKCKDVAVFLYCSCILEERTFQLYRSLSEKIEYPPVKSLLISIAYDSLKHSRILRETSRNIPNLEMVVNDCKKNLGELWKKVDNLSEEIFGRNRITDDEFSEIINSLVSLEDLLKEEYFLLVQLKTLQFMAEEISRLYQVDIELMKNVFESIIIDKEYHREILLKIIYFLAKRKTEKVKINAPEVRYQNPDAWNRPYGEMQKYQ